MAELGQRISDLIGSDYSVIPEYSKIDLVNAAIAEVADMLPPELLMKYNTTSQAITDANGYDAIEEKKVLLVTRELNDTGTSPLQECRAVPYQEFLRCGDSKSIYEATKASPVYSYDISGATAVLKILPAPSGAEAGAVYYFEYPSTDQTGVSILSGLPDSVLHAVALKASVNLLHAYISDFVQDEEDAELQQMVAGQIQILMAQFQSEMKRFMEQDATPRGE